MIKKVSLHRLNNNELNTLVSRIIMAINAANFINVGIVARIFALVVKFNGQFIKSLNTSFQSEHAEILRNLDELRDDAFRAIRDALLACSRRLNDNFRLHAQKLIKLFKTHGWALWRENYQSESSKMSSLIGELKGAGAQASLTELGLNDWLNELIKAQDDFEKAFQDKASDDIKKDFIALKEIRPELIKNTYELLDRINLDAKYGDDTEAIKPLIKTLNNIIDETTSLAKSRITRNEHNDED